MFNDCLLMFLWNVCTFLIILLSSDFPFHFVNFIRCHINYAAHVRRFCCKHTFSPIMLILCEKFQLKERLLMPPHSLSLNNVIIISNRLYILLYNQSSIICGLNRREWSINKSIQLNSRLLLLSAFNVMHANLFKLSMFCMLSNVC